MVIEAVMQVKMKTKKKFIVESAKFVLLM